MPDLADLWPSVAGSMAKSDRIYGQIKLQAWPWPWWPYRILRPCLNTFQIGQNDTFSTQNYKIDIQELKTNMVYEINGANNLYFKSNI